ncbi:ATPase RavA stimulator ViaA [Arsenophonus nasoniae]|uniref:ATPase RavA stimulator ViaA n=1 Tax=Arsenophonus nasoniae TaxID=638 RepID=A0AA95K9N5_9GAMM|nr:ATPase RavA stimulator ViaA [Arsenophonus nasoniae]WGL95443.1 ATPase RavA stimulator ViaA [Arsenophonus nasoniae]WGM01581.1 ATPase RavA stimulator ViaA [Arsenophonus nasoniae]
MLNIATIDMLLSINEVELIEEIVLTLLATPQLVIFFEKYPNLKSILLNDLLAWKKNLYRQLQETLVPIKLTEEFALYQQNLAIDTTKFFSNLPVTINKLTEIASTFVQEANYLQERISHDPAGQSLFIQRWRLNLIIEVTTFNKLLLEREKEQLLAELEQRLKLTGNLIETFNQDNHSVGKLWDISKGVLTQSSNNIQLLIQYSHFLQQQPELEKLAELLGRRQSLKPKQKQQQMLESIISVEKIPDQIPEQISGINHGNDILRLLPSELALLGLEELEFEFYRKLVEKQLLTYRLQGDNWQQRKILRPAIKYQEQQQLKGPFIVCIDTSGSMGKFNERCAKAFCLALMKIAMSDNRQCHIILFSKEVIHYDLLNIDGLEQLMQFLNQTFSGGTDLAACLNKCLEKMQQQQWKDSDVVVISDFIAQRLPDNLIKRIKIHQTKQQRFHAVTLSKYGKPGILNIFDYIWHFDTGLKSRFIRYCK